MQTQKIAAILLLAAGALGLIYGGFTYTRDTHRADLGPVQISVSDRQRVGIPVWAGVGAMLAGGMLLLSVSRRR
jgi:hypothetical protein